MKKRIHYECRDEWLATESIYTEKYRKSALWEKIIALSTFAVGSRSVLYSDEETVNDIANSIAKDICDVIIKHTSKPGLSFEGDLMVVDREIYKESKNLVYDNVEGEWYEYTSGIEKKQYK